MLKHDVEALFSQKIQIEEIFFPFLLTIVNKLYVIIMIERM